MPVEVIHSKTGSSYTDERFSHQNSNTWKLLEENVLRYKKKFSQSYTENTIWTRKTKPLP